MKLWLDDEREAPEGWTRVYTVAEAYDLVLSDDCTHVSLDHDLGTGDATGYTVACIIEDRAHNDPDWVIPVITCHSANPVGRKRIEQVIERLKRQ